MNGLFSSACSRNSVLTCGSTCACVYSAGGFQAIALLGFVSPLACSLFGPAAGRMLDRAHRPFGLGAMVALQGLAIAGSAVAVLAASANSLVPFVAGPWFVVLLLLSMLERLTAITAELAIERDWVTQLSGAHP